MGMNATKKNVRVADELIEILIKEKCTIQEAKSILYEISQGIEKTSMVQMGESYQERFNDVLEQ